MGGISGKQGNGEAYGPVVSHGVAFGRGMGRIGARTGDIEKTLRIREIKSRRTADESCEVRWGFEDCSDE